VIKNVALWLLKISNQLQPSFQKSVWIEENQLSVTLDLPLLVMVALGDIVFRDCPSFTGVKANVPRRTADQLWHAQHSCAKLMCTKENLGVQTK